MYLVQLICLIVLKKLGKQKMDLRKVLKFLHVSTDEVYGSLGAEGFFMETTPIDPHSPYSSSKASQI